MNPPRHTWSVITTNFGSYDDVLPTPKCVTADWVYVTESRRTARLASSRGWRAVLVPPSGSPFLQSRYAKTRPDKFTERQMSLYVDARFAIESEEVLDSLAAYIDGPRWLALFRHPFRRDIFEEAMECQRLGLVGRNVAAQMSYYRSAGTADGAGLWCGGILVRRHGEAQRHFGRSWYHELERWPTRDQLSLPVVMKRCDIAPAEIPGSVYDWPGVVARPHRARRHDEPLLRYRWRRLTRRRHHAQ